MYIHAVETLASLFASSMTWSAIVSHSELRLPGVGRGSEKSPGNLYRLPSGKLTVCY